MMVRRFMICLAVHEKTWTVVMDSVMGMHEQWLNNRGFKDAVLLGSDTLLLGE
jgi:hypothetical protein